MPTIGDVLLGTIGGGNTIGQRAKDAPGCARLGNALEMPFSVNKGDHAIREAVLTWSTHRHHKATATNTRRLRCDQGTAMVSGIHEAMFWALRTFPR